MANRKRVIPIVGILLLAGLFWFGKQWWYGRAHESTDNAQVDGHLVPVLAKVGGYVTQVKVEENQTVPEGKLLVQIDSSEYLVRLAQANAELAAARAAAGGGGNAEVVTAALGLTASRNQLLDALTLYQSARVSLARAEGAATTIQ